MLSEEGLISTLNARGYVVSRFRLTEWIRDGLLPHPTRRGRGRGRGVTFVWDNGDRILEQAERICQALRWNRRVSNIVLPLWVMGYDVPLEIVRRKLLSFYDVEGTIKSLWDRYGQADDEELEDVLVRMAYEAACLGVFRLKDERENEIVAEFGLNAMFNPKYKPPACFLKKAAKALRMDTKKLKAMQAYLSRPALAQALAKASDSDFLWARDVIQQALKLSQQAIPSKWGEMQTLFSSEPDMLFNLAYNTCILFVPVLVKLRCDSLTELVEGFLGSLEQKNIPKKEGAGTAQALANTR